MGLDVYLYRAKKAIEIPSKIKPDHLFKIGYFRSSYNSSGINNTLSQLCGGRDLYAVFNPGNEYEFSPDWNKAREVAVSMIDQLEAARKSGENLHAFHVSGFGDPCKRGEDAVALVIGAMRDKDRAFGSYSNRDGHFYIGDPMDGVVAVIPGVDSINSPGAWVVRREEPDDTWTIDAMRIVVETIDYVLASGEVEKYRLRWSS